MAYYTALIAKWATLAPDTTANKLAAINAITITGSVPTSFFTTGDALLNCIVWSEFSSLTATKQANLLQLCATPGQLLGGSGNVGRMVPGMFLDCFTVGSGTIANLTALAKATVTPWWQALVADGGGGLSSPVGMGDLAAAGGLT